LTRAFVLSSGSGGPHEAIYYVAMEFFRRAQGQPANLGILPGTFNPPTRAHFALVRAAAPHIDEALFVLPRAFPHKRYEGANFEDRVKMIETAAATLLAGVPYSIASTKGGLFIEIARECRQAYGAGARLLFLCGRDAAERAVTWDYGRPGAFAEMLGEFELLVFPRQGSYKPPAELRDRIHVQPLDASCDGISSTKVRERVIRGGRWEHLVPGAIASVVRQIYRRAASV
jgi:nicotinate-nucleotide adenylyltransferase